MITEIPHAYTAQIFREKQSYRDHDRQRRD
jgi:hypothetical protein